MTSGMVIAGDHYFKQVILKTALLFWVCGRASHNLRKNRMEVLIYAWPQQNYILPIMDFLIDQ